jgi:undecaprenyl-diphosphatase
MSLFHAFLLGLLQGLTEFLPVSSSAHLKIAKLMCGIENSESLVIFDLMCHLGTLVAILYFFRKEIYILFTLERKKLGLICIAMLPLIPCYVLLKPVRDFASAPQCLGFCLMGTAVILFLGERWRIKRRDPLNRGVKDVLYIGMMQASALIPGISRSASTISCARVLGWEASEAVRFSFLLSIPTVIGGNCLELLKMSLSSEPLPSISVRACAIGFLTACIAGLAIVRFAITFLQKGNLRPFAWYCLIVGSVFTFNLFWRSHG